MRVTQGWVLSTWLVFAAGCNGGTSDGPLAPDPSVPDAALPDGGTAGAGGVRDVSILGHTAGPSPFIAMLQLGGAALQDITDVGYTIDPRPGSASRPVSVSFSFGALQSRGYVVDGGVSLPVVGLYAGYDNTGSVRVTFRGGATGKLPLAITTDRYVDPTGIYDHPRVLQARQPGSAFGVDFFAMKSAIAPVVIVDSDAAIRWVGTNTPSMSVIYTDGGFVIGDPAHPVLERMELDGTARLASVSDSSVTEFHHNIDPGKQGLLGEVDTLSGGGSVLVELAPDGTVLKTWDMARLLADYMSSQGDDPSGLVRPDADWFHMNAATYDARDDSVIVSSREQFLVKVDYTSGEIRWIFGDPTKYWFSFASLRAKALLVPEGGLYPIGQHSTSITSDGLLMLFDDGFASQHVPDGAPVGENRTYSRVAAYAIDPVTMTAREAWHYDNGLYSRVCSSAYEGRDQSALVDYAVSDAGVTTRILGLDAAHQPVFDFAYANDSGGCDTSWNTVPVPLDDLRFE